MEIKIVFFIIIFISAGCKKENIKPDLNFSGEAKGCGSFIVYKLNDSKDEIISVMGDRDNLNLTKYEKVFNLQSVKNNLKVEIKRFDSDASGYYCDDIADNDPEIISTWTGIKGIVKIQIVQDSIAINPQGKPEYKINVVLENINFENKNGKKVSIDNLEFKKVYVGWLPG